MIKQYLYSNGFQGNMIDVLNTDYCLKQSPKIYSIKKGIILPRKEASGSWGLGGVIDENNVFVNESKDNSFGGYYDYDYSSVLDLNYSVLYLGYTISHWGIFLTDFTRRLYYYFITNRELKIAFCGVNFEQGTFGDIENNCYDFFDILGIQREKIIDVRVPMRFSEVIVPELGFDYDKYFYMEHLEVYYTTRVTY